MRGLNILVGKTRQKIQKTDKLWHQRKDEGLRLSLEHWRGGKEAMEKAQCKGPWLARGQEKPSLAEGQESCRLAKLETTAKEKT